MLIRIASNIEYLKTVRHIGCTEYCVILLPTMYDMNILKATIGTKMYIYIFKLYEIMCQF
jgi:hypothetical protein